MRRLVDSRDIAGAVTMVVNKDGVAHLEATGLADIESMRPMRDDTIFWIASMTKPVTGAAIMMLQDEGKLHVDDLVAKYIPEFASLETPSGAPANLTIRHMLTHTSGLAEATREEHAASRQLEDLIPHYLAKPMQFEPGAKWHYCQSGINTAGRIVEIASGMPVEVFFHQRIFEPLGMKDTAFFLAPEQLPRVATNYDKDRTRGALVAVPQYMDPASRNRPPLVNGGLFSTAPDYARFCRMLLNRGTLDGRRCLKPESVAYLSSVLTGDLQAGFVPGSAWGLGVGIVREPRGIAATLSPGSFGHGGRNGTQAWIDPVAGTAQILMIQRNDIGNSDGSEIRQAFHQAAASALAKKPRD